MFKRVIPHLCLDISVMMLILFVIDRVNEAMNFIGNDVFDILLLVYCLTAIPTAVFLIADNRRRP
jgi:hypothetical protein